MKSRSGSITTIFIAIFCIFIGIGVFWYFIREAVTDVSSMFMGLYPVGVYNPNNLATLNLVLLTIPFFALISISFFVYISIKKRNRIE